MNKLQNVIFLGRKPGASAALRYLVSRGIKVKVVVAPDHEDYRPRLKDTSKILGIRTTCHDKNLYEWISKKNRLIKDVDLVISYLFEKKIKLPLISSGKLGCINFHPALLPDYKSRAGYNTAILERRMTYGVSAHYIDSEELDSGPIIKVLKFKIDPDKENAHSLEQKSQEKLLKLFKRVIGLFLREDAIKKRRNVGGLYLTAKQLEDMKYVNASKDSLEDINRKIRAFFFPPYSGAKIMIKDQEFTLINESILDYIYRLMQK